MGMVRHGSENGMMTGCGPLHRCRRRHHHPYRQQQTSRLVWTLIFVVMATFIRATHAEPTAGERYFTVDSSNDGSHVGGDRRNIVQFGRLLLLLTDLKLRHNRNHLPDYDNIINNDDNNNDNHHHQRGLALSYDDREDDDGGVTDDVQGLSGQNIDGDAVPLSDARMSKRGPGTCINSCMTGGMSFIRCKSMCN